MRAINRRHEEVLKQTHIHSEALVGTKKKVFLRSSKAFRVHFYYFILACIIRRL